MTVAELITRLCDFDATLEVVYDYDAMYQPIEQVRLEHDITYNNNEKRPLVEVC